MQETERWTIDGSEEQPILGNAHLPDGSPRGAVIIAHGFKGYKDYGMFPRLADALAGAGFIAHRFNFSHSGMTCRTETFEKPELFQRDTWNRQVEDLGAVMRAASRGALPGGGLPQILLGHSRGGVSVLLTAGRHANDASFPQPAAVITVSAPDRCNTLSPEEQRVLLEQGWLESPSSRTGQALRIGSAFLQEQLDEPAGHDVKGLVAKIRCPLLIVHGSEDPTVPVNCAHSIADAAGERASVAIIEGGDHVFNTPNPLPREVESSPQLSALIEHVIAFAGRCVG